ncbi:unnamed protein product [Closterium sp. NIES-54]
MSQPFILILNIPFHRLSQHYNLLLPPHKLLHTTTPRARSVSHLSLLPLINTAALPCTCPRCNPPCNPPCNLPCNPPCTLLLPWVKAKRVCQCPLLATCLDPSPSPTRLPLCSHPTHSLPSISPTSLLVLPTPLFALLTPLLPPQVQRHSIAQNHHGPTTGPHCPFHCPSLIPLRIRS